MIDKFTEEMKPKISGIVESNLTEFYTKVVRDIELYVGGKVRVGIDKDENGDDMYIELPFTLKDSALLLSFKYNIDIDEGEE